MEAPATDPTPAAALARRHLRFGWWALAGFAGLGIALESMHGFKVGWYLDAGNETRRLLLTLAHAHGVLLALVNLAFAATLRIVPQAAAVRLTSPCLVLGALLVPAGFFLGGLVVYAGDPGLGIFLLPIGAALLVTGLVSAAWAVSRAGPPADAADPPAPR